MAHTSTLSAVVRLLDKEYGRKAFAPGVPLVDELVQTVLSQNTTAANCRLAYGELRARFPHWNDVLEATPDDIACAIRVGGLANSKARVITAIVHRLRAERGEVDLDWLAELPDGPAFDYLMSLGGIGPKTAACVLMFGLGRAVLPVDTHVHRVAERLGLIERVPATRAHDLLNALIRPEDVYSFHVNAVTHGRRVCRAARPRCSACVLRDLCDYAASHPLPGHMP